MHSMRMEAHVKFKIIFSVLWIFPLFIELKVRSSYHKQDTSNTLITTMYENYPHKKMVFFTNSCHVKNSVLMEISVSIRVFVCQNPLV